MSFLGKLFGVSPAKAAKVSRVQSQLPNSPPSDSRGSAPSATSNRREMLRVVLHSTLKRHGIPASWVGGEMVVSTSRGREPAIHLRLLIRHWDPRLLDHAVALQNSMIVKLLTLDTLASNWLAGVSWQFALADESVCPAMPPPEFWTAGPVASTTKLAPASAKSEMERLLAANDANQPQHLKTQPQHLKTQPMHIKTQPVYASTEPMPLEASPALR
jgi:hypothetical protein